MWIPSLLAIVGSTLCVAVAAMGGCGGKGVLSCETEIPACLQSCISAYGLCTICNTNLPNIQSCVSNVCGSQGALASTYFRSICATDNYKAGGALISVSESCQPADKEVSIVAQESQMKLGERRAKMKTRTALRKA